MKRWQRWQLEFTFYLRGKAYTERPEKKYWFRWTAERARQEYTLIAYSTPSAFSQTKIEVVPAS